MPSRWSRYSDCTDAEGFRYTAYQIKVTEATGKVVSASHPQDALKLRRLFCSRGGKCMLRVGADEAGAESNYLMYCFVSDGEPIRPTWLLSASSLGSCVFFLARSLGRWGSATLRWPTCTQRCTSSAPRCAPLPSPTSPSSTLSPGTRWSGGAAVFTPSFRYTKAKR